ncbi:MAG: hypothetical protein Q9204_005273 [Flavoplaca sp. TL-2023a]
MSDNKMPKFIMTPPDPARRQQSAPDMTSRAHEDVVHHRYPTPASPRGVNVLAGPSVGLPMEPNPTTQNSSLAASIGENAFNQNPLSTVPTGRKRQRSESVTIISSDSDEPSTDDEANEKDFRQALEVAEHAWLIQKPHSGRTLLANERQSVEEDIEFLKKKAVSIRMAKRELENEHKYITKLLEEKSARHSKLRFLKHMLDNNRLEDHEEVKERVANLQRKISMLILGVTQTEDNDGSELVDTQTTAETAMDGESQDTVIEDV